MKILALYKRHNMGIDSISRKHGRMYAICKGLSERGHEVHAFVSDYHPAQSDAQSEMPTDFSCTIGHTTPTGLWVYIKDLHRLTQSWTPDIILAGSDAAHVIAGHYISRRHRNTPFIADLKDNYEAFRLTRLPLVRRLFVNALRQADGISCVSGALQTYLKDSYGISNTCVIENAVDTSVFFPRDKAQAREQLNLPSDKFLIGTAGALNVTRGIHTLTEAYSNATRIHDRAVLVVAGKKDANWRPPEKGTVIDLGTLEPDQIPTLFSALDVGIVCNQRPRFGNYCYPQKYCEMVACGLPVIASNMGIFSGPDSPAGVLARYDTANTGSLTKELEKACCDNSIQQTEAKPASWNSRIDLLTQYLEKVASDYSRCQPQHPD